MPASREQGSILWFRDDLGEGAVQTDSGRFLRFSKVRGAGDFELGQRVDVFLTPEAAEHHQVAVAQLPPPVRFDTIEQFTVACATRALDAGEAPVDLVRSDRALRRTARAAPTRKKTEPPRRKPGEALDRNTPVKHPDYGAGFVVMSTSRVARVAFGGRERQVRVADLELLDR
jgi:cold shock CspA family protein